MLQRYALLISILGLLLCPPALADSMANPLTHGNVQSHLHKGVTTQAEVVEVCGVPNITTLDADGNELWVYQRHATTGKAKQKAAYGTLIVAGLTGSSEGYEQSSRTITLKIKFDARKKVVDFNSFASSF